MNAALCRMFAAGSRLQGISQRSHDGDDMPVNGTSSDPSWDNLLLWLQRLLGILILAKEGHEAWVYLVQLLIHAIGL